MSKKRKQVRKHLRAAEKHSLHIVRLPDTNTDTSIDVLELPTRVYNAVRRQGLGANDDLVTTIGDILAPLENGDWAGWGNFGVKSHRVVCNRLQELGYISYV
jgi:hypothetical protein